MPFGYLGTTPNQQLKNSGVFSVEEALQVQKDGEWGGSLELINTVSFSSVTSTIDITNIQENKYDVHLVQLTVINNGSGGSFYVRTSQDNGSSFDDTTGDYQHSTQRMWSDGNFYESYSNNASAMEIYGQSGNGGQPTNRYIYIYNAGNSSKYTFITAQSSNWDAKLKATMGGGVRDNAHTVNAIRFFTNVGGGFLSGTAKLYGIKQI
jgi:hypothetical protein|tara:strand:+ start:803 stop:1426 length:624 start_codon:yes stop_codon:yes gene_type:complete